MKLPPLPLVALLLGGCAGAQRPPAEAADLRAAILRAEDRRVVDEALRGALAAPDDGLRAQAFRALGRMRFPAERDRFEAALVDTAPAVRREAATALALLADPGSKAKLETAATDADAGVRARALEALGLAAAGTGSGAVRAALLDPVPEVARAAALSAWRLPDALQATDALGQLARAAPAEVRRAAAYALARMGASGLGPPSSGSAPPVPDDAQRGKIRDHLVAIAREGDPEIRMQAARGLAHPGRPTEAAALEGLAGDLDPRVRVHAARSLAWEGAPIGPALARLLGDDDLLVVQAAVEGLGRIRSTEAKERLLGVVAGHHPAWISAVALDTLLAWDAPAATEEALGWKAAPDTRLRAAAARALGTSMPDALLADPDLAVRTAAVAALATADPFDPRLVPFATGSDAIVRASLAEPLGTRMEAPGADKTRALAALGTLWGKSQDDPVGDARDTILDAAGKAGRDPAAQALILEGLKDREWLVRRRAAEILTRVYGEDHAAEVGAASDRSLADYAAALRWAAVPHRADVAVSGMRIGIALQCGQAPLTCLNFACLANRGFYDGHVLHRVVPGFVIQDGDPRGDGSGGPGYAIRDEVGMAFAPGVLGMASAGYDTPGSQWFVTSAAQPHLDLRYTAFGTVTEGFEAVPRRVVGDEVASIRVDGGASGAPCGPDPRSP